MFRQMHPRDVAHGQQVKPSAHVQLLWEIMFSHVLIQQQSLPATIFFLMLLKSEIFQMLKSHPP